MDWASFNPTGGDSKPFFPLAKNERLPDAWSRSFLARGENGGLDGWGVGDVALSITNARHVVSPELRVLELPAQCEKEPLQSEVEPEEQLRDRDQEGCPDENDSIVHIRRTIERRSINELLSRFHVG